VAIIIEQQVQRAGRRISSAGQRLDDGATGEHNGIACRELLGDPGPSTEDVGRTGSHKRCASKSTSEETR
jgi:hypothetical protein